MPFGLGFGELLLTLIVLGVLVALILLVARGITRSSTIARNQESQRLETELQQAQRRIAELEAKLTRTGES
jgi:Tfp pilus assembly protein PilN